MLGALVFERDPITPADIPFGFLAWLQVVGGFAFMAIVLWALLGYLRMRRQDREQIPRWKVLGFSVLAVLGAVTYVASGSYGLLFVMTEENEQKFFAALRIYSYILALSGAFFVAAVAVPFSTIVLACRLRRIYALAKLSFMEAVRRRVVLALLAIVVLPMLFAPWFFSGFKPEDEVRNFVAFVFFVMTYPLLLASAIIASFSIPADIKNQTIHTIVTKPVDRFEIVLGRFFGFLTLMTLVLVFLSGVSLLYVLRGVNHRAQEESLKARVPLYGNLRFENTDNDRQATNVGREWDYRSHITKPGPNQLPQTARWDFARIPAYLAKRDEVSFEYTFDVYRTTKGAKEGSDVTCTVRVTTWRFRPGNDAEYRKLRSSDKFRKEKQFATDADRDTWLAKEYGFYEIPGLPVTDYHTQNFTVPAGLIENATAADPERESELKARGTARPADLIVRVTCDSDVQYVGMAQYDLYARLDVDKGADPLGFSLNFCKAAFGLWLRLALVIGLCVVLSTALSGVISFLVASILYFFGVILDFVTAVALGRNDGGAGPMQAMLSMARREQGVAPRMDDTQATVEKIVYSFDDVFRWVIRRIIQIFPDVNKFSLTDYVAEGFDIPWGLLGTDLLLLIAYLVPWFVLGAFMLRWREIASST